MFRAPIGTATGILASVLLVGPVLAQVSDALQFDGINDVVQAPHIAAYDTQVLTVEAWVYVTAAPTVQDVWAIGSVINRWPYVAGIEVFGLYVEDLGGGQIGLFFVTSGGNGNLLRGGSFPLNTWHHVAAVYNSGTKRLYLDGSLVGENVFGPLNTSTAPLAIGRQVGGPPRGFPGLIDEVRFWNTARSQVQIQATMDRGLLGTEAGLIGYWRFDSADGQSPVDSSASSNSSILGDLSTPDSADPNYVHPGAPLACTDDDSDGYFAEPGCGTPQDCNDASPTTYPGAPELCDGYDNNCDSLVDNAGTCSSACASPDTLGDKTSLSPTQLFVGDEAVAWSGTVYAVAWIDERIYHNPELYFARVDVDGNPVGQEVRLTNAGADSAAAPSLVWTGSEYGVAWQDGRDGGPPVIYFARIDSSGVTIGADVPVTAHGAYEPSLVWAGSEFAIAWTDYRGGQAEVYFVRLNRAGQKIGEDVRVTSASGGSGSSIVWTGSEYALIWSDNRDGNFEIYFARLDATGTKIGQDVRVTNTPNLSGHARLVSTGSQFGLVWAEQTTAAACSAQFARLSPAGTTLSSQTIGGDSGYGCFGPSLAWTGTEYGVAWNDTTSSDREVYFARIDSAGAQIDQALRVTATAYGSFGPSLVWTGSRFGVAWTESVVNRLYFGQVACGCSDGDGDGTSRCNDCDDDDATTFPGAPEQCDAVDNDCDGFLPIDELDEDGDGYVCCNECACDDPAVNPGADELCDGVDNNCNGLRDEGFDRDSDGFTTCGGDCDDSRTSVYVGAPQVCDGLNNDCADVSWPTVPAAEVDNDADAYAECQGDCDDANPARHPGAAETCNAIDDNCNALVDEDAAGVDTDSDGVHNACDNCRQVANPSQLDTDHDAVGNSCDNCTFAPNPGQQDADADARGDACDNCRLDYNPLQDDYDGDRTGDACDNCLFDYNPAQTDMDHDIEGDLCDLDDGLIYILFHQPDYVEWQEEQGFTAWNSYRGSLAVLRTGGPYTQLPGSNPLASRQCGLTDPWAFDDVDPAPGKAAFFLTTGVFGGEGGLGKNSAGVTRPNANPCP